MGYDIERFVGYVNEGLLCCICQDVLEDPLQAPCEHAFCASCIHGWLVHHSSCPEDRQALNILMLRPLYRYMQNDLNRLQLHCRNGESGCEMVCSLESVEQHERECEYGWIFSTNTGFIVQVEHHNLNSHLATCEYQSQECPKGCGYTVLNLGDMQHNCIAELKSELEMLSQMSQMMSNVQSLIGTERQLRQELEQAELEKQVLMELLKSLQDYLITTDENEKPTSFHSLIQLENVKKKKKTQGGDDHLKKLSCARKQQNGEIPRISSYSLGNLYSEIGGKVNYETDITSI